MKRGYIIEFKRKGFVSGVLGGLLKLLDRSYDGWGWHLALSWERADTNDGWYILEALAGGVEVNYYDDKFLSENTRNHKWLDKQPTLAKMGKFLATHHTKKYDVAIYLWTSCQYLIRHFFNRRIPRLLDDRFTCWELVTEFCEEMGKPIISKYDCPMLSDILKVLKGD